MDRTGSAAGKTSGAVRCAALHCLYSGTSTMRCSRGVYVSNVYPFAGIAFEGLLLLYCICGVGSSACGCGAGLAIIIRSSSRRWCGGSWKHKGKLRIACLLLLVLAALTNQSRRFGFRLSLSFFFLMARRGIPAFSSQHVAHRGDRAAAPLPLFGTAHSASGVSESAGGRSTAQLVRSQRPAGLPAAPSQATARRPTSQLLQRAYVCVVLPCTLLRRIEREILRAACHAHAARPRRF